MNTQKTSILLSIKPVYAELILSGKKTIELRKKFSTADENLRLYLYATSPAKKIVGAVDVKSIRTVSVDAIDANIESGACADLDRINEYYKNNKKATLIEVEKPVRFNESVTLSMMRDMKHSPHNSHKKIIKGDILEEKLLVIYRESLKMR